VSTTPRRRYNNTRRLADAETRQRRIVEAATTLFVEHGFAGTSIDQIAAAADVSPQTVYATYGSKAMVLSRAIDVAVVGDFGAVPLVDRLPELANMSSAQLRVYFTSTAHFVRMLHERVAPLMRMMEQAAATDPGLEELRMRLVREMRATSTRWIAQLESALQPELTEADAADVLVTVQSPYVYSALTVDLGWSPAQYEQWLARALPQLLLRRELLAN
jgi:AcrR family transcriptional regulator